MLPFRFPDREPQRTELTEGGKSVPDAFPSLLQEAHPGVGPAATGAAFERLGRILARALEAAGRRFGADAAADPFRGLYATADQAAAVLRRPAGEGLVDAGDDMSEPVYPGWHDVEVRDEGWRWLRAAYGLTDPELDVVLVALAPEADLAYERVYGYLQDDVTRRRPTVELALQLAFPGTAGRAVFRSDAPLLRERLVDLVPDPRSVAPPLLAHAVVLDEQITDVLLAGGGLDRGLTGACRLSTPPGGQWTSVPLPAEEAVGLLAVARSAWGRAPLHLHFAGPRHSGRRATAAALVGELGAPLLELDPARLPASPDAAESLVFRCFREAVLQGAVLHVDGLDLVPEGRVGRVLDERMALHAGLVITSGGIRRSPSAVPPLGVLEFSFERPGFEVRRRIWRAGLAGTGQNVATDVVEALAGRFRFGPHQVAGAVASAVRAAGLRLAGGGTEVEAPDGLVGVCPTPAELFAAARRQTGQRLADLARHVAPERTWDELVLPTEVTAQLRQLCERVTLRERVWGDWGFERTTSRGRGVTALFTGPPGTGKTLAAEVVAGELGLDLFTIDLSSVVSKYIGETEKNLERLFSAASEADAVLLFDEADALFGKRSQVHDAHDRYANVETAYLLQRMEQYDGIAILATNLRQHLDDAFTRRLQFIVDFPFPDEGYRERIWRTRFPADAPVSATVDCARLGRNFRLSGAGIHNAVLHAAFLAAADSRPIGPEDLACAAARELEKAGKVPPSVPAPEED